MFNKNNNNKSNNNNNSKRKRRLVVGKKKGRARTKQQDSDFETHQVHLLLYTQTVACLINWKADQDSLQNVDTFQTFKAYSTISDSTYLIEQKSVSLDTLIKISKRTSKDYV